VKIAGNTIINHEGSAIEIGADAKDVVVSRCLILQDHSGFWSDPLLWVALKIIKRKYYNLSRYDSSNQTIIEDENNE